MKQKCIIVFALLAYCFLGRLLAQEEKPLRLSIAYFGEMITHPGFEFGVERGILQSKRFELFWGGRLGMCTHRRNHTAVFLGVESGQRMLFPFGLFLDHKLGLAYLQSIPIGGPTYVVDAIGDVKEVRNLGRAHIMPSVTLGLGWDLEKHGLPPIRLFGRTQIFWQLPFNTTSLVHFGVLVGVSWRIKGGLN